MKFTIENGKTAINMQYRGDMLLVPARIHSIRAYCCDDGMYFVLVLIKYGRNNEISHKQDLKMKPTGTDDLSVYIYRIRNVYSVLGHAACR